MPIYEFECQKCEKSSELLVRSSNWKGTKCPHCGSTRLAKKFSIFASSVAGSTRGSKSCGGSCSTGGGCCGGGCCGGGKRKHRH